MDFLPPSGGVFRLALARSSPGIPCRRSCGFQGATGKTAIKKPSQNRPALPSLFLEGHASQLCNGCKPRCSAPQGLNEYVKTCYIQFLGETTTKIEPCQQKTLRLRHFRQGARKNEENFGKKREGWTVPALLTRQQQPKSFIPTLKPSSSRFRPGLQNALAIRKKPCYNAAVIES